MIYKQTGFFTNYVTPLNTDNNDFEKITNIKIQIYNDDEKKENVKKYNAGYFVAGEFKKNENGTYLRNDSNLLYRTLICLDYDSITISNEEFKNIIYNKLKDYNFFLYPSISYTQEQPRYRLIIEPQQALNALEYKNTIKDITDKIGLKYDNSSATFSQLQGLPITQKRYLEEYKKNIIINKDKEKYPVIVIKPSSNELKEKEIINITIDNEEAIKNFKDYCIYNKKKLEDYNFALSCIMVLAKSVRENIITEDIAFECCRIMGLNNDDWIDGNIKKLKKELNNNNIHTSHDFYSKFSPIFYKEPKNNRELETKLLNIGAYLKKKYAVENGKIKILSHSIIADVLLEYLPMVLIGAEVDNALLYFYDYDKGVYDYSNTYINKCILCIDKMFDPLKFKKVHEYLKTQVKHITEYKNKDKIAVNNGIFDLNTKKLENFSPKYYFTSKIITNYNEEAEKPLIFDVDNWIKSISCNDEEIELLLWQMINECLNPNYTRGKIGVLLGDGNNGKGTYQALITNLIGKSNISTLKPEQFSQRFMLSDLIGKTCNIGDDISNKYIDDITNLFSIATGDPIAIDRKNKNPINAHFSLFCMFSANDMPKVRNKSDGTYRRLLIVPFNADFNGEAENKNIKQKYIKDKNVLEYVLYKALNMNFDKFSNCKQSEEALENYKRENDYLTAYIEDEYIGNEYHLLKLVPVGFIKNSFSQFLKIQHIDQHMPYNMGYNVVKILNKKVDNGKYINKKVRITKQQREILKSKLCDGDFFGFGFDYKKYPLWCVVNDKWNK